MSKFGNEGITLRKVLMVLGIVMLVVLIGGYVLFQARNFIQGPSITLTDEYVPVHHEKIITISGVAKNIVKLTLNGKEIHTDSEGVFTHKLILENGYTITTLTAQDRFGRVTEVQREYVYVSPPAP